MIQICPQCRKKSRVRIGVNYKKICSCGFVVYYSTMPSGGMSGCFYWADADPALKQKKRRLYALLEMLAWKKIFYEDLLDDEIKNFRISRNTFIEDFRWKVGKVERWEAKLKATAERWGVVCPKP